MRVVGQDVPSALFSDYCKALKPAFQKWSNRFKTFIFGRRRFGLGPDIYYARKRSPWRLPHMQSKSLTCPSAAQQEVRMAFKRCVMAFNASDRSLSWIDKYGYGPESRNFWWKLGQQWGVWYYNFFLSLTWLPMFLGNPPAWCRFNKFTGSMVGDGVLFDPDTNYEHFSVWWAGAYFQPEGNKIGEAMIFLKKDPAYPYKYFSRFVIQSGYQSACYVDVYGVPLPFDASTITWNNMPPLGPKLGRYLIPNNSTYCNILTYKVGTHNLFTSSIWEQIAIKFVENVGHSGELDMQGLSTVSRLADYDQRPYLTP